MAKSNAARAQGNQSAVTFDIAGWAANLLSAATNVESGAKQLLDLALSARGKVDPDVAREKFQEAFAGALVATHGVTEDEARASKSFKNRVSDAMAVFKAEDNFVKSLPSNLQRAADSVRKAKREATGGQRAPRAGGKGAPDEATAVETALDMTHNGLEQLRHAVGDNVKALEAVAAIADMLKALEDALDEDASDEVADAA